MKKGNAVSETTRDLLDGVRPGDVQRIRNWDHHQGNVRLSFNVGQQPKNEKVVGVFLFLGQEPLDETKPQLDLEKRMNDLGWFKKET